MGTWTLQSIVANCSDFENTELFGTNFTATYRLIYNQAFFNENFKEMPRLDWHETIMMNEHNRKETWVFDTNMYTHNPTSKTLEIWSKRYIESYNSSNNQMDFVIKGSSRLLDKKGVLVKANALAGASNNEEKAEAVRNYLKSNGGILEIKIEDIPSIYKLKNGEVAIHKERLLLFDVGMEGGGTRVQAFQYLNVNQALPKTGWTRKHGIGWGVSSIKTTGFTNVAAPTYVSRKRDATFFNGECW